MSHWLVLTLVGAVCGICAVSLAAGAGAGGPAPGGRDDFYISPDGRDDGPGTRERPFATLARARDAVRAKIAAGLSADLTVLIRGGTYRLSEAVVFGPADGGTEKHSVTYAASPGEKPIFSGGVPITGWKDSGDGTWSAAVPQAKDGRWRFRELFATSATSAAGAAGAAGDAGQRRPRARHPNATGGPDPQAAYLRVAKVVDPRWSFQYAAGEVPALKDPTKAELVLLHDWSVTRVPIKGIDAATRTITTAEQIGGTADFWRINGFEPNPRYFLEGAPEFCDAPGEWCLDPAGGVVTYRPMPGEAVGSFQAVAPLAGQLLVVQGDQAARKPVRNLRFVGLTFEHTAWMPANGRYAGGQACFHWSGPARPGWGWQAIPPAVLLESAEGCRFERSTIRHVSGSGIWLGRACRNCQIVACDLTDIAGNGVMIGPDGKRPAEEELVVGNVVRDCLIERCGAVYFGAVGAWVGLAAGNTIAANEIRDLPYTGVSVGWMWNPSPTPCKQNIVENNHIHHVMLTLSDGGGIYTLGWQPGTVLRGNLIHDVPPNAGRAESNGMFLDEGTTDIVIEDNCIYNTVRSPLRFHKAGKNLIRKNQFALGKGVPAVRYNNTPEPNIELQDNSNTPADQVGGAEFQKVVERFRSSAGPRRR